MIVGLNADFVGERLAFGYWDGTGASVSSEATLGMP